MKKYENLQRYLSWEKLHGTKDLFDLKVVGLEKTETYFSLDEKELATVLKAHDIMNDRRFGRSANER